MTVLFALFIAKLTDPLMLVASAVIAAVAMIAANEWIRSARLQLVAVLAAMLIGSVGVALSLESSKVNGIYCPKPPSLKGVNVPADAAVAEIRNAGLDAYFDCFMTARTEPQIDWMISAVQQRVDDNEILRSAVGAGSLYD